MQQIIKKALTTTLLAALLGTTLLTQGCASTADPRAVAAQNDTAFFDWYTQLADAVKADPHYHRIELNTDEQANEFVQWLHDTWQHRMTVAAFRDQVNQRYPGHDYEINFIVQRLPR